MMPRGKSDATAKNDLKARSSQNAAMLNKENDQKQNRADDEASVYT